MRSVVSRVPIEKSIRDRFSSAADRLIRQVAISSPKKRVPKFYNRPHRPKPTLVHSPAPAIHGQPGLAVIVYFPTFDTDAPEIASRVFHLPEETKCMAQTLGMLNGAIFSKSTVPKVVSGQWMFGVKLLRCTNEEEFNDDDN